MMGMDGMMHEKALQSEEEDTEKAAQEEAENEALVEALERDDALKSPHQQSVHGGTQYPAFGAIGRPVAVSVYRSLSALE